MDELRRHEPADEGRKKPGDDTLPCPRREQPIVDGGDDEGGLLGRRDGAPPAAAFPLPPQVSFMPRQLLLGQFHLSLSVLLLVTL